MHIIYSDQLLPETVRKTIFLAGPTPRNGIGESWRPKAINILRELGYNGHVFVPEPEDGTNYPDYDFQVKWEQDALDRADCILFWIPRDLEKMPAFTTNIEFGERITNGNIVLGFPTEAAKMRYLELRARDYNVPMANTLEEACKEAIKVAGEPGVRTGGEATVPGYIWSTPSFKKWYIALVESGNKLINARALWTFRIPNGMVFSFALKVNVYVASEDRNKTNEFVFARSDIGAALLYCPGKKDWLDTEVVLVSEFRSPASTSTGFVLELPSGSSLSNKDMYQVAIEELEEETGLSLPHNRFIAHHPRQLAGTLSSHKSWLVSAVLTKEEMDQVKKLEGKMIQGKSETEKTYIKVRSVRQLIYMDDPSDEVDFTTLGCIIQGVK